MQKSDSVQSILPVLPVAVLQCSPGHICAHAAEIMWSHVAEISECALSDRTSGGKKALQPICQNNCWQSPFLQICSNFTFVMWQLLNLYVCDDAVFISWLGFWHKTLLVRNIWFGSVKNLAGKSPDAT